ncbi:MAG: gamma-glutamyl-gamma-aminobutyrate hydrolase [Planctomycetes bacterium]|nr:gamma-glutamyl-gamma-aminobutyrate hydrolase [Planctomycetota bacterium]
MKTVLVSQRVEIAAPSGERRDALAQDWHAFLARCGLAPILVPNHAGNARALLGAPHCGVLLTGGNDLASLGGDAPERDEVERLLVEHALAARLPVLGVCRGMQFLVDRCGGALQPVDGHVTQQQWIEVDGRRELVNSYHRYGCRAVPPELEVWARADDGVVEAVRHRALPLVGIMWHPERFASPRAADVELFRRVFGARGPEAAP